MYQIEVKRSSPEKEKIFRRYREFDELQSKLMQCFPDAQLPQLPGKILIPGKSHTKQVSTVLSGMATVQHMFCGCDVMSDIYFMEYQLSH